jgi:hypothetical protein
LKMFFYGSGEEEGGENGRSSDSHVRFSYFNDLRHNLEKRVLLS